MNRYITAYRLGFHWSLGALGGSLVTAKSMNDYAFGFLLLAIAFQMGVIILKSPRRNNG